MSMLPPPPDTTSEQASDYAKRFADLANARTEVVNSGLGYKYADYFTRDGKQVIEGYKIERNKIAITIGNLANIDETRKALGRLGIYPTFSTNNGGQILIDAGEIADYEKDNGKGSFFRKLDKSKDELIKIINDAKKETGTDSRIKRAMNTSGLDLPEKVASAVHAETKIASALGISGGEYKTTANASHAGVKSGEIKLGYS